MDDELAFICSAKEGFPQRICYAFLERIKAEYFASYHGKNKDPEFKTFLMEEMVRSARTLPRRDMPHDGNP